MTLLAESGTREVVKNAETLNKRPGPPEEQHPRPRLTPKLLSLKNEVSFSADAGVHPFNLQAYYPLNFKAYYLTLQIVGYYTSA